MSYSYPSFIPGYRPDIDGLRAVAILPVLFFHFGVQGFGGGYVGVDIFFVISGFLITGILIRKNAVDRRGLVEFWERRVRRIMPAVIFLFAVVTAVVVATYLPIELARYGQELLSQSVFSSNILFMLKSGGYFDAAAETRTLLHTWSLAVEEQFYLLYPVAFIVLFRKGVRWIVSFLAVCTALSLLSSVLIAEDHAKANFYLLPFRAWELGLGCLLAFVDLQRLPERLIEPLALLGMLLITISVSVFDDDTIFPGAAALVPCLGALFLIASAHRSRWVGLLLRTSPMVGIGKISYSLYLWHWPILVIAATTISDSPSVFAKSVMFVLSFLLAWISWRWVEMPFRGRKAQIGRPMIFGGALAAIALFFGMGWAFHLSEGMPKRWPAEVASLEYGERDRNPRRQQCVNLDAADIQAGLVCSLGNVGQHSLHGRILVWGDSHADSFLPVMEKLADQYSLKGWQVAQTGCKPLFVGSFTQTDRCVAVSEAMMQFIKANDINDVVLISQWRRFRKQQKEYVLSLADTIAWLKEAGITVWLVRQVPEYPFTVPRTLARAVASQRPVQDYYLRYEHYRQQRTIEDHILGQLHTQPDRFLDPSVFLCANGNRCINQHEGKALYWDEEHLNYSGAMLLHEYFARSLFHRINLSSP